MTAPQTEKGYTRIANELLEALIVTNFLGSDFSVVMFIIRKTYGYHKKTDRISISQIAKGTNFGESCVSKCKKRLTEANVITSSYGVLGLNKDYEQWKYVNPLTGRPQQQKGYPRGEGIPTRRGDTHAERGEVPTRRGVNSPRGDIKTPHAERDTKERKKIKENLKKGASVFSDQSNVSTTNPNVQPSPSPSVHRKSSGAGPASIREIVEKGAGGKWAPRNRRRV